MTSYEHILTAVDLSPAAESVIKQAKELADLYAADLRIIHVVEYQPPIGIDFDPIPAPDWLLDEKQLVTNSTKSLAKLLDKLDLSNIPTTIIAGTPKHEILKEAKQRNIQLLVVGSHGRHGIGRLLGSTADALLHNAPCDVLAVRIT